MKILKLTLFIGFVIICGCTITEDTDFVSAPSIFIYGDVTLGQSGEVYVSLSPTTSKNINPTDLIVKDAVVKIIKGNGETILLKYDERILRYKVDDSIFFSGSIDFQLEVKIKEGKIIKSDIAKAPLKPLLSNIDRFQIEDTNAECGRTSNRHFARFIMTWERDFYPIEFNWITSSCDMISSIDIDRACILENYSPNANRLLMPKDCFKSKNISFEISYKKLPNTIDQKIVIISTKSLEYLLFWDSQTDPKAFFNGFVEPKNTFTNIKGGVGVFFISNNQSLRI